MNLLKAISDANVLRPNDVPDEMKARWALALDATIAEMYQVIPQDNPWPNDIELLAYPPYDDIYTLFLCAQIDNANEEVALYANDATIANNRLAEFKAAFRRNNRYYPKTNWRTL